MASQQGVLTDDEGVEEAALRAPTLTRRVSRVRQFGAVLHKNYLLQTRTSRAHTYLGAAGWAALLIEIAIPAVFFTLMCIPKHYLNPMKFPQQVSQAWDLDATQWALQYEGPAHVHEHRALLLYAPNSTEGAAVMDAFARSVSCPADPAKKGPPSELRPSGFYKLFRQTLPTEECAQQEACLSNPDCSKHLLGPQIAGYSTMEEALDRVSREADTVDAVIGLKNLGSSQGFSGTGYVLRVNHTEVPSTKGRLNQLDVLPDNKYMKYWMFGNIQFHLDRAILGLAADGAKGQPALIEAGIKPFPWPAVTLDVGAAAAAFAFNLLLVFAFLVPTRGMVATIVREKELRLREGMRILGLKDAAYWCSWALSHFATLAASMLLCAIISLYPFRHSSFTVLLAILWLVAAALIAFAYFMSTLFSTSRVAGIAAAMLYSLSMVPGYLIPTFQPYGGWGWYLACLAPPSAVSLFANVLINVEASNRGLHWDSLGFNVTSKSTYPFSARVVFIALTLDILLYSLLAAYFDKVMPSEVGANLPWNFPFKRSYWSGGKQTTKAAGSAEDEQQRFASQPDLAVSIRNLRKVFRTTEGVPKAAVDGLSLDISQGDITALLGANGAGKTTTISILTGMLAPTSGNAFVHGQSILHGMAAIRQSLGVCPQFDILWPEISVREHLQLYAAIKGYSSKAGAEAAISAAEDVGLGEKLDTLAGNLSGGQRRKLSVAIAFLGSPAVVILDEPTSGMDPYSRRFTWEVIKRNKAGHAIIITTHSMEEADLLCDQIAIMAEGSLAAAGTSMDLKKRFGVGYRLTVVKQKGHLQEASSQPNGREGSSRAASSIAAASLQQSLSESLSESDGEVESLIKQHVAGAHLLSRGASEIVFRLPKEDSSRFPDLLRELEGAKAELGVSGYGLSETTLEEVFLTVTSQGKGPRGGNAAAGHVTVAVGPPAVAAASTAGAETRPLLRGDSDDLGEGGSEYEGDLRRPTRVQGVSLYCQQLWALLVKRAISAKRDRLAVWTQLCVPILLVLVALLAGRATSSFPQEPALRINREECEFGAPTVFGATAGAKANSTAFDAFQYSYPTTDMQLTDAERLWEGPFFAPVNGTFDGYLLDHWSQGGANYEGLFVHNWSNSAQIISPEQPVTYTVLVNQTATHAVPAALNSVHNALLRALTGDPQAAIAVTNHPMPTLSHEAAIEVSRETGDLLLVLFTIMASALLSASFALFLVRERENASKNVQMISGAPVSVFWLSTFLWDLLNFSLPAAGILICYAAFDLPEFQGPRLGAFAVLLAMFGLASLPLTYLLHFAFDDEMKALQWINSLLLLSGYLGFLATWILDQLYVVTHKAGLATANRITQRVLRILFPHFNLARGMYEVASTHQEAASTPDTSPWTWTATGQWVTFFALQAVVYMGLTLLLEAGWWDSLAAGVWHVLAPCATCCSLLRQAQPPEEDCAEDEDVERERYRIQDGRGEREGDQVLLSQLDKAYGQGAGRPLLWAVRGVSVGIAAGECFGLLGVNGAGKSTTFKILTGEVMADTGEAKICGRSVRRQLAEARRQLGYCPQFSALPGALTGREVLRMYARLRGVPGGLIEGSVQSLLQRLDLAEYADRACESYSGGNKRKLSVAVALVGEPPVVMLDEPSTGMDPGAKRFLWDILQKQVIDRGHTVLLTSHSMEECEALCTRIAIMRAGRLRCLGSVQHLKNRFGAGYVLEARLRHGAEAGPVVDAVKQLCSDAEVVQQSADSRLSFRMPQEGLDLSLLFERMESLRESLGIEEYSISQTTLEHVFVQLAQQ